MIRLGSPAGKKAHNRGRLCHMCMVGVGAVLNWLKFCKRHGLNPNFYEMGR